MRRYLRYLGFILVATTFIAFNVILLENLTVRNEKSTQMKPKIVLISHDGSNPYWQSVRLGAEKAARERNAIVEFEGPDTPSISEGIKLINMAYAAKVSGIITYVQDEDKYKPVIDKAIKGDIPVVTVDSDAENSNRIAYVGTDNAAAGIVCAKEMIKSIGTTGDIGIIMGGKTVKNQVERVNGFTDYIKKHSNIQIKEIESSDSYLLEAELSAKKILKHNHNIKALFCVSSMDGHGAVKAVNGLGLVGKIKIISFDDLTETLNDIRDGFIAATIVQEPFTMGYKAVNIIMDNIAGKHTNGVFLTNVQVVNEDNLDEYRTKQGD